MANFRWERIAAGFAQVGFCWPAKISIGDNRPMRSAQEFLRHAIDLGSIELGSEFFHGGIFAGNFTSLLTVQGYLCGD
jgi:hypothetical protein